MSRPDDTKPVVGNFLDRWAKRKQAVQHEQAIAQPLVETPPSNLPSENDESLPLPSLDDILPGRDVSAFFQKHVPEALRAAALRKVWMTDPDIRDFIEMADYQLDYANPDSIPGWSSSIEGIDLKGMVEKIFNNAPKIDADLPEIAIDSPRIATEPQNEAPQPVNGHSTLVKDADMPLGQADPVDQTGNGAVQNKPDESVVYETARKRHGSALPS